MDAYETLISVWRQVLVEDKDDVELEGSEFAVISCVPRNRKWWLTTDDPSLAAAFANRCMARLGHWQSASAILPQCCIELGGVHSIRVGKIHAGGLPSARRFGGIHLAN